MPIQTESTGSHSRKMRFAEIPALFYLIISGCQSGRHKPLLRTFTGTIQDHQNRKINLRGNLYRGTSSHEMGFCHPYPYAKHITDKGENKIRCMRVLFNFSMFMASLLKPEQSIIEKPFLLKKLTLPLPCNCSTSYINKKCRTVLNNPTIHII